jgi:hypothetical protein
LTAPRCKLTSLWKLALKPKPETNGHTRDNNSPSEAMNVVFSLPSACQIFLWYHAAFPTKETFLRAVQKGNYLTLPKLTTHLIHKYFPDSDKTIKGHITKEQRQGKWSTKLSDNIGKDNNKVRIKIEGEPYPFVPLQIGKQNDIFVQIEDFSKTIHTDQTGVVPYTSQLGNCYIMVGLHLNANYIFAEPMKNRTEGKMIRAYQQTVN